jgi:hypothetical protein
LANETQETHVGGEEEDVVVVDGKASARIAFMASRFAVRNTLDIPQITSPRNPPRYNDLKVLVKNYFECEKGRETRLLLVVIDTNTQSKTL